MTSSPEQRKKKWFRDRGMDEQADALADETPETSPVEALEEDYEISDLTEEFVSEECEQLRERADRMASRTPQYSQELRSKADALETAHDFTKFSSADSFEALAKHVELGAE
jgi:hypothetical protein